MQDFALYSVYKSRNINNRKEIIEMKTMKIWRIAFMMLAAFSLASCKPSARQTTADAEQPTDSTEAVTSADTLRLVITDKHLAQTDFLIRRTQKPVN